MGKESQAALDGFRRGREWLQVDTEAKSWAGQEEKGAPGFVASWVCKAHRLRIEQVRCPCERLGPNGAIRPSPPK